MIKEIAFTSYPAKNVAALRKWYEEHLDLRFSHPYVEDGVEKYNEANVGGGYFSLMSAEWQAAPGTGSGVTFEVDDLDASIAGLRAKSIEVEEPHVTPVCKLTSFHDPEGNKVTLHQITVPH
jgi:predicted enzyme related to lactoylglutathione lyase